MTRSAHEPAWTQAGEGGDIEGAVVHGVLGGATTGPSAGLMAVCSLLVVCQCCDLRGESTQDVPTRRRHESGSRMGRGLRAEDRRPASAHAEPTGGCERQDQGRARAGRHEGPQAAEQS